MGEWNTVCVHRLTSKCPAFCSGSSISILRFSLISHQAVSSYLTRLFVGQFQRAVKTPIENGEASAGSRMSTEYRSLSGIWHHRWHGAGRHHSLRISHHSWLLHQPKHQPNKRVWGQWRTYLTCMIEERGLQMTQSQVQWNSVSTYTA